MPPQKQVSPTRPLTSPIGGQCPPQGPGLGTFRADRDSENDQADDNVSAGPSQPPPPTSQPMLGPPSPVPEGPSPPSKSTGPSTLEALIASSPACAKQFYRDCGVKVADNVANAKLYAKAIILIIGANKLINASSQLKLALCKAMPLIG